ncbi:TrmH family RNA methyltransferase [Sorangium sp. So ce341]|uniref:TrmH family RNA methyltransferase n=1 Tax=Sorangium sp. So ce341 TaxID=3133302 RepID=UPI003F60775E
MRRSTPNCSFVAQEQRRLLAALDSLDVAAVARILEEFVTDERKARLRGVIAARLDAVTVAMDAPHDPHNGAAVLRSCDAFGLQRLHIIERAEQFLVSNTVSRGSERWVDVRTHATTEAAVAALRASGHELVATRPDGELTPRDLAGIPRLALVLGNERDGIRPDLAAACARAVRVPMRGFAESLNVSVTAAILLEQATSGRPGDLPEPYQTSLYARALVLTVPHAAEILAARGMRLPPPLGGTPPPPPQPRGPKPRRPAAAPAREERGAGAPREPEGG